MLNTLVKQVSGLASAAFAAAVCGGQAAALAAMGSLGLGAFTTMAWMFPVFVALVSLSLWLLYGSSRRHGRLAPFYLALTGGVFATVGMWLNITGMNPLPGDWPLYVGGTAFLGGSLWDALGAKSQVKGQIPASDSPVAVPPDPGRRTVNGAAITVAAAGAFYGLYQSVETFAPRAEAGEIACWGANSCKGQTACRTAFNGCPGQNQCKSKGVIHTTDRDCAVKGGVPLEGSEADPNRQAAS